MGIAERRLRQKDEVRCSILATAWQIVQEEGWQSLSIRKIADAIEYSAPVIYDHFQNKEAILFEFGKKGFALLANEMQQAKEGEENPARQLTLLADAYWNFAFRNKEYYQLMFGLGVASCETEKCLPGKKIFRELVMQPIEQILASLHKTDVNPCLKYHTFWSVIHGLISIKMMNTTPDAEADELNKMVLDDAIAGFVRNLEA